MLEYLSVPFAHSQWILSYGLQARVSSPTFRLSTEFIENICPSMGSQIFSSQRIYFLFDCVAKNDFSFCWFSENRFFFANKIKPKSNCRRHTIAIISYEFVLDIQTQYKCYDFEIHSGADCRTHDKTNKKEIVRHWMQLNNAATANWIDFLNFIQFSIHCMYIEFVNIVYKCASRGLSSHKIHEKSSWNLKPNEWILEWWIFLVFFLLSKSWLDYFMSHETFLWDFFGRYQFFIFNNATFCQYQHLLK